MKNILNINFDSKMNWDRLDAEKTQPKEIEIMDSAASVDTDLEILREQFKAYVDQLKKEWLQNNRSKSQDVFEVMNPTDRHEVERIIKQWSKYIEPLAEAWWNEKGYKVIWPADDSEPMKLQKLK